MPAIWLVFGRRLSLVPDQAKPVAEMGKQNVAVEWSDHCLSSSVDSRPAQGTSRRSIRRMTNSSTKAMAAITRMPITTTSVTRNWAADWIMKPSPRVAATSSAATSVDQPAPSAMRSAGQDRGQRAGQDHMPDDLRARRAKRAGGVDAFLRTPL